MAVSAFFRNLRKAIPKIDDEKYHGSLRKPFVLRRALKKNARELSCWLVFAGILAFIYKFASDRSFSGILTAAALFQCFAFSVLLLKVVRQSSAAGVSIKSLQLYLVATSSRLFCNLTNHAYLPVDASGDWVYQFADAVTVVLLLTICLLVYTKYSASYPAHLDTMTPAQPMMTTLGPLAVTFVLALLVRPALASNIRGDIAWCFGLYTDSVAMLPQLVLMTKLGGEVEALTSHYVASVAVGKVFAFTFWAFSYRELSPTSARFNVPGLAVLLSHVLQMLLFADFLWHYLKAVRSGRRLILSL